MIKPPEKKKIKAPTEQNSYNLYLIPLPNGLPKHSFLNIYKTTRKKYTNIINTYTYSNYFETLKFYLKHGYFIFKYSKVVVEF